MSILLVFWLIIKTNVYVNTSPFDQIKNMQRWKCIHRIAKVLPFWRKFLTRLYINRHSDTKCDSKLSLSCNGLNKFIVLGVWMFLVCLYYCKKIMKYDVSNTNCETYSMQNYSKVKWAINNRMLFQESEIKFFTELVSLINSLIL